MALITLFSTPKPFTDPHINLIQRNAIQSWLRAGKDVDILLIGEEDGLAAVAEEYGVLHVPDVKRNESNTPLLSSIFQIAHEASDSEFIVYVNTDIILPPNFQEVVQAVAKQADDFLAVGHRWDLDVREKLTFPANWAEALKTTVQERGKLRGSFAIDYFIFPRKFYAQIPNFAIGRASWDNWMIYRARQLGLPVIVLTPALTVIHQNHGFGHIPGGKYKSEEAKINLKLAGGRHNLYYMLDATHEFRRGKILPARWNLARMIRKLELWVMPKKSNGKRWYISRRLNKMWLKVEKQRL